ncbi:MAG: hypothetical protein M3229_02725, partial [Actinomycetota bacterium]|nr:hypothetical protein [Actinomycetota bacterium]
GLDVAVAGGARLVGKKVRVRVERVMDGTAYATLVSPDGPAEPPITAEAEAERPTRRKRAKAPGAEAPEPALEAVETDAEVADVTDGDEHADEEKPKKRSRRGTRGGRGRKRKTPAEAAAAPTDAAPVAASDVVPRSADGDGAARIHLPPDELGAVAAVSGSGNGAPDAVSGEPEAESAHEEATKPKRKTRRGTRGGRNRRKKAPAADQAPAGETAPAEEALLD